MHACMRDETLYIAACPPPGLLTHYSVGPKPSTLSLTCCVTAPGHTCATETVSSGGALAGSTPLPSISEVWRTNGMLREGW
jgi:hypothetical protein